MLTTTIAILSLISGSKLQGPTAKELIEKMMARYHAANTVTGTIRLTVATEQGSASMSTALQYDRAGKKLYIFQQKEVASPEPDRPSKWLVTSDGLNFSYNVPNSRYHQSPGLRLAEPVTNERLKVSHDIGSIYIASSESIGDRSMPLDIAIAARSDLVYRRNQWVKYEVAESRAIGGKTAYIVKGPYRAYRDAIPSGTYTMAITAEGDLLQYTETLKLVVGNGPGAQEVLVTSTWDVDLKVNGTPNANLFKVVY